MSVYAKLQKARGMLLSTPIKKSGKNKFAGFEYFELADFIPAISDIFHVVGLCGVVRFTKDIASLTVYDNEAPQDNVEFTSPMIFAEMAKSNPIQALGATHTYMRRYLWLMAMEIIENDAVDVLPELEKPRTPVVEKAAPKKEDPNQALFVEKMIEWATACGSENDLKELWKANQGQIDGVKSSNPTLFTHLKTCFAEIKNNIKE